MIYMGSKARFAKHIAPIVNNALGNSSGIIYEPFCGGCNLTTHFKGKVIANDINENLIELFKDAISGRAFPAYISREMYNEAKKKRTFRQSINGIHRFLFLLQWQIL